MFIRGPRTTRPHVLQILLDHLQVQMGSGIPISTTGGTTYPMETGAWHRSIAPLMGLEELKTTLGSKQRVFLQGIANFIVNFGGQVMIVPWDS